MDLNDLIVEVGETTKSKGFNTANWPAQLLLMVTEVGEALENVVPDDPELSKYRTQLLALCSDIELSRKLNSWDGTFYVIGNADRGSLLEELADICIRIFSFVYGNRLTPQFLAALREKADFNKQREYLHGKQN